MDALLNELQALESEFHHQGVRCSPERFDALLHPSFREVGRSGHQFTRETVVAHIGSRREQSAINASEYVAFRLAEDCALLTYRSSHPTPGGAETIVALRSSVWLRTTPGWQLLYHQGTPVPTES